MPPLRYAESVIDSVLHGQGVLNCPIEICYNTSIPGIPPPFEVDRPKCCLAHQTKFPDQFQVEYKSGESYKEANDVYVAAPPSLTAARPPELQPHTGVAPAEIRAEGLPLPSLPPP